MNQTLSDPVPALLGKLTDPDRDVRLAAAQALGRLGPLAAEALPKLTQRLDDGDGEVRQAAARALGQLGPAAVPCLINCLSHTDKYVRRQAVWGLGRLGPAAKPAVDRLAAVMDDPDPRAGAGAAQALAQIGRDAESAIPALLTALGHQNRVICRLAGHALSRIGPVALRPLFGPLFDADEFVRDEAVHAMGRMERRLVEAGVIALVSVMRNDPDSTRRLYAARNLGKLGKLAGSAAPALRELRTCEDGPLRAAAVFALKRIQG